MYWAARHVQEQCGFRGDLAITENGTACADEFTAKGEVLDLDRIQYLRSHLRQVHRAIAEGYPIKAYFVWSLMDNSSGAGAIPSASASSGPTTRPSGASSRPARRGTPECIRGNRVV